MSQIAEYYFGRAGAFILAVIVTMACLKTAIGLITSCGEAFVQIFPKGPSYHKWAVMFCILSFLIANLGLDAIIAYSQPVLMFLYPLAVVLTILTLFGKYFATTGRYSSGALVYGSISAGGRTSSIAGRHQSFTAHRCSDRSGRENTAPV